MRYCSYAAYDVLDCVYAISVLAMKHRGAGDLWYCWCGSSDRSGRSPVNRNGSFDHEDGLRLGQSYPDRRTDRSCSWVAVVMVVVLAVGHGA